MPTIEAHEYHVGDKETLKLRHEKSPKDYIKTVKVGRRVEKL